MSDLSYTIQRRREPDWSGIPAVSLAHTGWTAPCPISASARACWDGERLFIRLEAVESRIRATLTGRLDQVCSDSCLEFFFAPMTGDARYFNFEFNPLGTMNLGFGAERPTRVRQIVKKPEELFRAKPFTTAGGWGIAFQVPFSFVRLYFPEFAPGESAGNFYKCGDQTPTPHFLAWAPLSSPTPDFHRRMDFGRLLFEG